MASASTYILEMKKVLAKLSEPLVVAEDATRTVVLSVPDENAEPHATVKRCRDTIRLLQDQIAEVLRARL